MDGILSFLENEWTILTGAPVLVIAWTVVIALVVWKFKQSVDDGEIRGVRAEAKAFLARLALAADREKYWQEKFEDLERHIEKVELDIFHNVSEDQLSRSTEGLNVKI